MGVLYINLVTGMHYDVYATDGEEVEKKASEEETERFLCKFQNLPWNA